MSHCPYIEVADVRGHMVNCQPVNLGGCTDQYIEDLIEEAQDLIELITNDVFCSFTQSYTFQGNGKCKLWFPPKVPYKLLAVTEVTESTDGLVDTVVEGYRAGDHYLDRCCGPSGSSCYIPTSFGCWGEECTTITVTGSWGWEVTPSLIKKATKLLVLESLSPGMCSSCNAQKMPANAESVDWADFKITLKPEPIKDLLAGSSTGILEVDMILANYINRVDMFITL